MSKPNQKYYTKNWRRKQASKGLCIECVNKVVLTRDGKLGVFCEYHRNLHNTNVRLRRWATKPPKDLFPLDSFMGTPTEILAYMAGIVDGEGHVKVTLRNKNPMPLIRIGMTDKECVQLFAHHFGGKLSFREIKRGNRKPYWDWGVVGRRAGAIAFVLLPYMRIEKKITQMQRMVKMAEVMGTSQRWETKDDVVAMERYKTVVQEMIKNA